jgi:hypothetical protein
MFEVHLREHRSDPPISLYPLLAGCESAQLLHTLHLDVVDDYAELRRQIVAHGVPGRPRELYCWGGLVQNLADGTARLQDTDLGEFDAVLQRMPALRLLDLQADRVSFGHLELPELRELRLSMTRLSGDTVRAIARARWPKLRRITISAQELPLDAVHELLTSPNLPVLERLGLYDFPTSELVKPLLASPLLPRLRELAVCGRLGPNDLRRLYIGRAALAHLDWLNLVGNPMGDDLAGLAPKLARRVDY